MVVRRRKQLLGDHPLPMGRFALAEWPGTPQEALAAWRASFYEYWRTERYPGGLYARLAALREARVIADQAAGSSRRTSSQLASLSRARE